MLENGAMADENIQASIILTAQEKRCIVDVLDVLIAMDINLRAERTEDEKETP